MPFKLNPNPFHAGSGRKKHSHMQERLQLQHARMQERPQPNTIMSIKLSAKRSAVKYLSSIKIKKRIFQKCLRDDHGFSPHTNSSAHGLLLNITMTITYLHSAPHVFIMYKNLRTIRCEHTRETLLRYY